MNNENKELMTTEQQDQDKGGRPSKYEPKTIDRLLTALADGLTIKQACVAAGIGETTLSRWKDEHPELGPQLAEAREEARQKALAGIKKAGESDWRAFKAFLELSFPEYRQPSTKVEVNTQAQAGEVSVVCTPEERRAMIEGRQKFLTDDPKSPPQPEQPKLQPGVPIGPTRVPEDPRTTLHPTLQKCFEGCITDEQLLAADLGRFGNTD